jgi:hypothetical protein
MGSRESRSSLIEQEQTVEQKISDLLSWEWTKRREKMLISSLLYALLISSFLLPAQGWLPLWLSPFSVLLLSFVTFVAFFFLSRRWSERDSTRALWLLDDRLNLAARTLTAREILGRKTRASMELLVLREAGDKLKSVVPKRLFKRSYSWDFFLTPPILIFWFLAVWFDVGLQTGHGLEESGRLTTARKLKAFSSEIQERSKTQGLTESLKVAEKMENLAEKNLKGELSEKALNENLTGMAGKVGEMISQSAQGPGIPAPTTNQSELLDLRSEIDVFKRALPTQESRHAGLGLEPDLLGRLAALPHLSGEVERRFPETDKMGEKELREFLEQFDRSLQAQLDRRTLSEIQRYLEELVQGAGGETLESMQAGREAPGQLSEGEKSDSKASAVGTEPGSKEEREQAPPFFQAQAPRQLKGQLGEGKSRSLPLNIEPPGGKSKISEEEVIANYRRQAEEDLASEKIPEGLKETIRKYFLALGKAEKRK